MKGARDQYVNIILTPSYDWAVSSHIYVKAKSCLCVMVKLIYNRRTLFFWDMTLCHRALTSWPLEGTCLSSGVQNAANCSVLSDWFKIMFCNRKQFRNTCKFSVFVLFFYTSQSFSCNILLYAVCQVHKIWTFCQVFEMDCFNKTKKMKEKKLGCF